MKLSKTVLAIVALLMSFLVLTGLSIVQSPSPLQVDDGTLVNVAAADAAWQKTYGGAGDDRAFSVLPVGDDFLVVGSTRVSNVTCGWALMLDSGGDAVWNRTYLDGSATELRCAVNISDGYLLVGNMFTALGDQNGYVLKIDLVGNVVWQAVLGGNKIDKLFGGVASAEGYVVYGLTNSYGNLHTAAWAIKLDGHGDVVWDKSYVQGSDCALRSGVAADDGLVVAGYTDTKGDGNYDFLLLKIAQDGSLSWNRTYGGVQSEKAYSMTQALDGYVLVGETESLQTSTDAWVLKVDFDGNTVWSRILRGANADSPSYVTSARDGGFLVCGFTFSFGEGNRDFWLFKVSSEGQVLFSCTYGDAGYQEAYGVVDCGSNQYVMVGWTDPLGRPDLVGKAQYDFLVAKINAPVDGRSEFNLWLTVSSVAIFAVLIATFLLLLKMRPKKQK